MKDTYHAAHSWLVRRALGFATAAAIALAAQAAQPVPAAAPSTGTLYAVEASSQLVTIDPASGAQGLVLDVGNLGTPSPFLRALVADPASFRLYGVASQCFCGRGAPGLIDQILTVDSQTKAFQLSPALGTVLSSTIAWDPSTSSLLGMTACCAAESVVRVDPVTGVVTPLAPLPDFSSTSTAPTLALDPATHTLYVTLVPIGGTAELLAVNTSTGIMSPGTPLAAPLISLAYDVTAGALIGVTSPTPHQLVRVNAATGSETAITTFGIGTSVTSLAIDPSTHTAFVVQFDTLNSAQGFVASIDELTGATTVGAPMPSPVDHLAFQPMLVTPDSIKADVRSALAGGAITNAGVANSLLAQLNAASAARSRGQCATAANIYQAFINELSAQSGKLISSAMASQLTGEARFLMANCP